MGQSQWMAWVWYAVVLHLIWGCGLLYSPAPQNITAMHVIAVVPHRCEGMLFLLVAILAAAMLWFEQRPTWWGLALIMPQQLILMGSAYGAIAAVIASQFADGVERPRVFLLCDQSPAIIASAFHTIAICDYYLLSGQSLRCQTETETAS